MTARETVSSVVSEVGRRLLASLPVRCLRRWGLIDGRSRSFAIAGQAFTTLIPLLILVAGAAGDSGVGDNVISRFRLDGQSADAVQALFDRPPRTAGTMSIVGLIVLLASLLSLTRSLQRAYESAWALPSRGLFGTVNGLTGVSLLVAQLIVLTLLTSAIRPLPAGTVLSEVVRLVLAAPVWLLLQYLLLSRRIPVRALLPGAAIAAIGQAVLSVYSAVWMPHIVAHNAERYGLIGVTFALVSWLIVIGIAIVGGAVLAAELAGRPEPAPR
jgi:membrane protein